MAENSAITLTRRIKICLASSGGAPTLPPVTHVAFGIGGVDEEGEPIAPSESQTELMDEVGRYPVNSVEYPVQTTARYSVTIPADELTGVEFSEAALVDSDGDLAAIKTFYTKKKDGGTAFTFEFDDQF